MLKTLQLITLAGLFTASNAAAQLFLDINPDTQELSFSGSVTVTPEVNPFIGGFFEAAVRFENNGDDNGTLNNIDLLDNNLIASDYVDADVYLATLDVYTDGYIRLNLRAYKDGINTFDDFVISGTGITFDYASFFNGNYVSTFDNAPNTTFVLIAGSSPTGTFSAQTIPEPAAGAMILGALGLLALRRWRAA